MMGTCLTAWPWGGKLSIGRAIEPNENARMRPPTTKPTHQLLAMLGAFALLPSLAGCGDGKIARYPVTGTVLVDGKPAENATVIFCPVDGPPELMRERPFSQTDANGRFELTTLEPKDGAPAGNYTVMIRWLTTTGSRTANNPDPDRGGGGYAYDRLGGRYFHPEKSGLTAQVEEGQNDLKFELTPKR